MTFTSTGRDSSRSMNGTLLFQHFTTSCSFQMPYNRFPDTGGKCLESCNNTLIDFVYKVAINLRQPHLCLMDTAATLLSC